MIKYITISLFILLVLHSCEKKQFADKIYFNGDIWTGNLKQPHAEYMAVIGEKIFSVGTDYNQFKGPRTEMVNLEGRFVVPGLIDNHTHFIPGGFQLMSLNLRGADSKNKFIQILKDYAENIPKGQWIQGGDWDHELWGGELPSKGWIDSFTEDIPVFLSRLDGHMALANSKALELAGITKSTPNPPGGLIEHDENGEPTGVLRDEALEVIRPFIPDHSMEEMDAALENALNHAASLGLTQVHDMCSWEDFETYIRNKDKLTLRMYALPYYTHWKKHNAFIKDNGLGDETLRWHGIKAMMDGSLGSRTAWMHTPYLDDPSTHGLVVSNDTLELRAILRDADKSNVQFAIHAIGTKANEWILNEFKHIEAENGNRDRRPRIEHAQHLTPKDLQRFHSDGVTASMQPAHLYDDAAWAHKRVGNEILKGTHAFQSLLNSKANLTFGSDWNVASLNPLMGIYTAVTRHTRDEKNPNGWYPKEKISVEDALRCYTINSAYAGFQEELLGTIEVGKLADFAVLSRNILNIDPEEILNTYVIRTVVGGKDVFVK